VTWPTVDVVLATYQGEQFIREQLASIAGQTRLPTRILVADDGSSDRTCAVIEDFASQAPFPVEWVGRERVGGASLNFARVLAASTADLVVLCDQDDVWFPERLEQLAAAYVAAGEPEVPRLLVHDLRLIDGSGKVLGPSFWRHQAFVQRRGSTFATLLVMNSFPGCAMVCNRALLQRALPIPAEAVMHDWWLALVAAGCGSILVVERAFVSYRLHAANAIGAPVQSWASRLVRGRLGSGAGLRPTIARVISQARALRRRQVVTRLPEAASLRRFSACARLSSCARRRVLWPTPIRKTGWLRQLGMWASL
jgi:glycosyltransferase involved in cell wall biosynthesis